MEVLDVGTTAVVLIDLQNRFMDLPLAPWSGTEVLSRCASIATRAREAGALVVLVRVEWSDADAPPHRVDEPHPAPPPDAGADWGELVDGLRHAGDIVVVKKQWGAFYGTDLELQLRRRCVRTVVLAGLATNFGVESTARQAWEHGFDLVVVSDAMSTLSHEAHAFALTHIFPRISKVVRSGEISFGPR